MSKKRNPARKKAKQWIGFFYILPWVLGFGCFQLYPFVASFYYSFTNYTLLNTPGLWGLAIT